jgi:quercetin dioxygenase-like cupin family protein
MAIQVVRGIKPEFVDERGGITKILDDGRTIIKSVLIITSKQGAIRANHYHKQDSHYVYMLSGSMEYTERPVGGTKKESIIVKKGDMVYSPPMVEHAMKFLEESAFLTLATEWRKQEAYEEDLVRVKLI